MSHTNHNCKCDHDDIKYCNSCKLAYCKDCNQEWRSYTPWTYYNTVPHYNNQYTWTTTDTPLTTPTTTTSAPQFIGSTTAPHTHT